VQVLKSLFAPQGWVSNSSKAALTKCQGTLLPSILKASNDAAPDIREAAISCLAALVIKQANAAFLEKVQF
jgi:HEAT repeat